MAKYNAANRILSHYSSISRNSLFCVDADTGVVYFVNQNQDSYIYRLKDGEAELAVPMPAKELYIWDGVLYFMLESYDRYTLEGKNDGDIYAYTPTKGTVELIYAAGKGMAEKNLGDMGEEYQRLTVNENGIYFVGDLEATQKTIDDKVYTSLKEKAYYLPFGATEPVTDKEKGTYAGWGKYYFGFVQEEDTGLFCVALIPRAGKFSERIVAGKAMSFFSIEDDIYLLFDRTITKKNLLTDEEFVYDTTSLMGNASLISFTMTEDSIWVINLSGELLCINRQWEKVMKTMEIPETAEELEALEALKATYCTCYKLTGIGKLDGNTSNGNLYTDGKSVYVLTPSGVGRVCTDELTVDENGNRIPKVMLLVEE